MTDDEKREYHRQSAAAWKAKFNPSLTPEQKEIRRQASIERQREKKKQTYATSAERRKYMKTYLKGWHYGITPEAANELDKVTVCPLCLTPFTATLLADKECKGAYPCIDHNHKTGKVRGVVCNPCNRLVGRVEQLEESGQLNTILKWIHT